MKKREKWLPGDALSKFNLTCLNLLPLVRIPKRVRSSMVHTGRRGWITKAALNNPINGKTTEVT